MAVVNATIKNRITTVSDNVELVCNNPTDVIEIEFDDEWNGKTGCVARFEWNGKFFEVPFTGNKVQVPEISNTAWIMFGVYADDIATVPVKVKCKKSILCYGDSVRQAPANPFYDEFVERLESVEHAIENGAGCGGENGADGKDGFSPIVDAVPVDGGIRIDITDAEGHESVTLLHGKNGTDGKDGANGNNGADGKDGTDGKSAYEYAKDSGFVGSEAEFAAKLAQEIPTPYTLPTASADTKGGVKVGKGLAMDGETLGIFANDRIVRSGFNAQDFEKGSIGNTGGNSDFYGQARFRSISPVSYPYDIMIIPHDRGYNIIIYDADGNFVRTKHGGWVYSRSYVPAGTNFRLLGCVNENDQTTRSLEELLDGFDMRPFFPEVVRDRLLDERDFEKGGLSSGVNSTYNAPRRCRTADITSLEYDLKITPLEEGYAVYACYYDDNGAYISGKDSGWQHSAYTIPAGKNFRLMLSLFENGAEPFGKLLKIEDALAGFLFEKCDVVERNTRAAEAIYAAKKYFDMTHTGFDNKGNVGLFTLAHITDLHLDRRRFDNFQRFCKFYDDRIDAAICTGDLVVSPYEEEFDEIKPKEMTYPVMYAVGNHDRSGASYTISADKLKEYLGINSLYYSKIYASQKIRLIVFDQYGGNSIGVQKYSEVEMNWLCSELDAARTAGQAVVIAFHQPECTPMPNDTGFYQPYIPIQADTYYGGGTPIEDVIAAFKAGGTVNKSYTHNDGSVLTVSHTFAAAGKFMAFVCGHMHNDIIGYSSAHPDQLYLSITAGAIRGDSATEDTNYGNSRSDLPRVIGTQSEDAFCVYGFDVENMLVKVVRVGSCVTSHMKERLMAVYEV